MDNIYDWKGSIGALEERKPLRNLWGYHQTRGLGYHEYFLINYQYSGTGIASIADENGVIHVAAKKSSDPTMKKEVIENGNAYKYGGRRRNLLQQA